MEGKLEPQQISDKIFELTEQFNHYVFDHPEILDEIPDRAVLVLLDADDEVFNEANIELARSLPLPEGGERVYVRMHKRVRVVEQVNWEPELLTSPE